MKAIVQRVANAQVTVDGKVISSIKKGICAFIGISKYDTETDMEFIANKILSIKFFEDDCNRKWKINVMESQYEVLCISQFTLCTTWKGNHPDFTNAMPGGKAKELYEKFIQLLRNKYVPERVKDGEFGAYMQVALQNDGPVTFEIQSPENDKLPCKFFQTDSFDLLMNTGKKSGM